MHGVHGAIPLKQMPANKVAALMERFKNAIFGYIVHIRRKISAGLDIGFGHVCLLNFQQMKAVKKLLSCGG